MLAGAYSSHYRTLEDEHLSKLKEAHRSERLDLLSRQRKLAQETHKRRKLSANKRRNEAEREERRRQEILQKRRESQREATERFQRGNRTYKAREDEGYRERRNKGYATSTVGLEDALNAIRTGVHHNASTGYHSYPHSRQSSADQPRPYHNPAAPTPTLTYSSNQNNVYSNYSNSAFSNNIDYRSNPSPQYESNHGTKVEGHRNHKNGSAASTTNGYSQPGNGGVSYQNKYARQLQTPERAKDAAREMAARAELHSCSLSNTTNSRSRFEEQLQQHQQLLVHQQRATLEQFNAAIQQEMDADPKLLGEEDVARLEVSDSVSSTDSLEPHTQHADLELTFTLPDQPAVMATPSRATHGNSEESTSSQAQAANGSNMAAGFSLHGMPSHPNVAVVRPSSQTPPKQLPAANQHPDRLFISHHGAIPTNQNQGHKNGSGDHDNADLLLEDANEFVAEAINDQHKKMEMTNQNKNHWTDKVNGRTNVHLYQHDAVSVYHMQPHPPRPAVSRTNAPLYDAKTSDTNQQATVERQQNAWSTPTPPDSQHAGGNNEQPNAHKVITTSNTGSSTHQANKPYSVLTMATAVSGPPNGQHDHGSSTATTGNGSTTLLSGQADNNNSKNIHSNKIIHSDNKSDTNKQENPSLLANHNEWDQRMELYDVKSHSQKKTDGTNGPDSYPSTGKRGAFSNEASAKSSASSSIPTTTAAATSSVTVMKNSAIPVKTAAKNKHSDATDKKPNEAPGIKGILKPTTTPPGVRGRRVPATAAVGLGGMSRQYSTARSVSAVIRDSIEITREQHSHRQDDNPKRRKKSVRFADLLYEEEEIEDHSDEDAADTDPPPPPSSPTETIMYQPHPPAQTKPAQNGISKSRPISAKVVTSTPKVDPQVKEPRVSSAGTIRRGPFIRSRNPTKDANNTHTATGAYHSNSSHGNNRLFSKVSTTETTSGANNHVNASSRTLHSNGQSDALYQQSSRYSQQYQPNVNLYQSKRSTSDGVYDMNGIRLDRTPTDDEINWLWDKVRTCLNRDSHDTNGHMDGSHGNSSMVRPQAQMAQKYIDGNSLSSQFQSSTRIGSNFKIQKEVNSYNYGKRSIPTATGVTTSATGAYNIAANLNGNNSSGSYASKRAGLLQQRKQNSFPPNSLKPYPVSGKPPANTAGNKHYVVYQSPTQSSNVPMETASQIQRNNGVSESMAAFIAAEKFSGESLSESEIQMAMELAQQRHNGTRNNVPSTLSVEEERLMQSLERLNERLKVTEAGLDRAHVGAFVPRPPPSGFRGHQPLSAHRRLSSSGRSRGSGTSPRSGTR